MSTNGVLKKSIQITEVDNPHKFWFKFSNDSNENQALDELERKIIDYVDEIEKNDIEFPNDMTFDVIVVFHIEWKKWIRGKAGNVKKAKDENEVDTILIWSIDYGCKMWIPLANVIPLQNSDLAYRSPINVHIGCLSGIVPAKIV